MSFSSLVDATYSSPQRSSRQGATVDHFILHHSASVNEDQVIAEMVSGSRQVSANYVIYSDGRIAGVVDEEDRAWTSGSPSDGGRGADWDRRSITFEVEDAAYGDPWPISAQAHEATAKIIADNCARRGITPHRDGDPTTWTVYGHRELWSIYGASYATACPGGMDLDLITRRAQQLLKGPDMGQGILPRNQDSGAIWWEREPGAKLLGVSAALWAQLSAQGMGYVNYPGTVLDAWVAKVGTTSNPWEAVAPTASGVFKPDNSDVVAAIQALQASIPKPLTTLTLSGKASA